MNLPNFNFEKSLLPPHTRYLLGIDEVGRGPLAGPVTIGAFLLDLSKFSPEEFIKLKVRDSKKLSDNQRQKIHKYFIDNNYSFKTFSASSIEIDQQGIAVCIYSLISKALKYYSAKFDFCLIDGLPPKQIDCRSNLFFEALNATHFTGEKNELRDKHQFVIDGDALCFSIAAASIVAKVDRDTQMDKYDIQYPEYGFNLHKGYGTKKHLEALKQFGPSPIHRLSFKPISNSSY